MKTAAVTIVEGDGPTPTLALGDTKSGAPRAMPKMKERNLNLVVSESSRLRTLCGKHCCVNCVLL